MTTTYTVSEAKNKLPKLIKQAEAGARVTITKRGVCTSVERIAETISSKNVLVVPSRSKL